MEIETLDDASAQERAAEAVRDLLSMLDPDQIQVAGVRIRMQDEAACGGEGRY